MKTTDFISIDESVERQELSHIASGSVTWNTHFEKGSDSF